MNMKKSIAALAVITLIAGSTASVSAQCRRGRCCVSRCQRGNCRPQGICNTGNCANGKCGIRPLAQRTVLKCTSGRCK